MIKKLAITNNIWDMPFLPPLPIATESSKSPTLILSNRINGEWKFMPCPIAGVPSPYAACQDFDFSTQKDLPWQDCIVPSSLIMQGFDIKNNVEYYYNYTLIVPSDFALERVFVRFEGVYSNARIWANGKYIATHIGGFTPFDIEITEFLGSKISLVVGVADIETSNKGIWNEDGAQQSDAAWASYYAHHNICGILRDVTIYCLPNSFILSDDIHTATKRGSSWGAVDADFVVSIDKKNYASTDNFSLVTTLFDTFGNKVATATVALIDDFLTDSDPFDREYAISYSKEYISLNPLSYASDCAYSKKYIRFQKCKHGGNLYAFTAHFELENCRLWSAESPELYTLQTQLKSCDNLLQTNKRKFGIRQIDFGGSHGTDRNKIYVNNKEIKLRGVCRHDVSHLYGRSITREDAYAEIAAYKAHNINHIRTSHYPADRHLIEACNELGIYVEMENSVCFKGANSYKMLCAPEEIMQTLAEMVAYFKQNPSITIWSSANESGFEKSIAFRKSYYYLKEQDLSRPTIFSYPFTVKSRITPYDIFSKHYAKVTATLGNKKMPKIHDEFAHVACYNINFLKNDNNFRLAWGESMKKGWDNIFETDGALGCAIWGGIDDVFYLPQGTNSSHQRHTSGRAIGYGEWGAVLDTYKRLKPEAFLTKKAFTPVKVLNVIDKNIEKGELSLEVENRFDHTQLSSLQINIIDSNGKNIFEEFSCKCIFPHNTGMLNFKIKTLQKDVQFVDVIFYLNDFEVEKERIFVNKFNDCNKTNSDDCSLFAENSVAAELLITDNADSLCVCHNTRKVVLDKKSCNLSIMENDIALASGLHYYFENNLKAVRSRKLKSLKISASSVSFSIIEHFSGGGKVRYDVCLQGASMTIATTPNKTLKAASDCAIGNHFDIATNITSVDWDKNCTYTYYPEGHLERPCGTANVANSVTNEYGIKPIFEWKDDNINYYLQDKNDTAPLLVSNDFKTTRTDINKYSVNFETSKLVSDNTTAPTTITVQKNHDLINCQTRFEKLNEKIYCTDSRIKRTGNWRLAHKNAKTRFVASTTPNSSLSVDFIGDGVTIWGTLSKKQGDIDIIIDGKFLKTVTTKSDICDTLDFTILDSITNLTCSKHNITVKIKDKRGTKINSFEVVNSTQKSVGAQLIVSNCRYYPSLAWGNYYGDLKASKRTKKMEYTISLG